MSEARPRPKRSRASDGAPYILGGRLWIAIGMLLGLALIANPRFNQELVSRFAPREPYTDVRKWKVGAEGDLRVTVITADAHRLSCGSDAEFEGARCAYKSDAKPWPPNAEETDPGATLIQPYRTSPDNQLILLAGLWAQPALSMRLHREPPQGVPVKRLQRFEARCRVKFLGEVKDVKVRWDTTARFYSEARAFVAKPLRCTIAGTE